MRKELRLVLTAGVVLSLLTTLAMGQAEKYRTVTTEQDKDIVGTAAAAGNFDTLLAAVRAADWQEWLRTAGPYTIFAPTDQAFAKLPAETLDRLLEDPARLRAVLKNHVYQGEILAADVTKIKDARTMLGTRLAIDTTRGVRVENATVTNPDIRCRNGVIHAIDRVLVPTADFVDTAARSGHCNTLIRLAAIANMTDALRCVGPYTLFAPTDEAFNKLPQATLTKLMQDPAKLRAVLKYHMINGEMRAADAARVNQARTVLGQTIRVDSREGMRINDARVTSADISTRNGVIHIIDTVLMPADDIIDVAAKSGNFNTLISLVDRAGLTDTLRCEGPYTLFAPTDQAFARMPKTELDRLWDDIPRLTAVLMDHFLGHRITAAAMMPPDRAKLGREYALVGNERTGLKINNANITETDIDAANGVIHVIDAVLVTERK